MSDAIAVENPKNKTPITPTVIDHPKKTDCNLPRLSHLSIDDYSMLLLNDDVVTAVQPRDTRLTIDSYSGLSIPLPIKMP